MTDLSTYLKKNLPRFKGGALRIFGDWFGRSHDNIHQPKEFSFRQGVLSITFDQDETLTVWNPQNVVIDEDTFVIGDADQVKWEWYYYGRPKLAENRYYLDYVRAAEAIKGDSNVDWYSPAFSTSDSEPAVRIE